MSALPEYAEFLQRKTHLGGEHGFAPVWMPDFLPAEVGEDLDLIDAAAEVAS